MQSSCNVIKNTRITENGLRDIETKYKDHKSEVISPDIIEEPEINSYNNIANSIIENARKQSEDIIAQTYIRAEQIQEEAYETGYQKGEKQGFLDAYNRAYEENVLKAQQEASEIIDSALEISKCADNILLKANSEYALFMDEKRGEIISLVLEGVKSILKKQVVEEEAINDMVVVALEKVKAAKTFVIKCNQLHVEALKTQVALWKKQLIYNCEVFVIEDTTLKPGNAVVEKDNGHLEIGIDVGFTRLKEILEEKDV